jgi:Zn-dependent peptidase ImmA (M78 family)
MIGSRLKLARAAAGLSLRELEARLQSLVTAQAIGKYERDEMMPSSTVLIALAQVLCVAPDYLLKQSDLRVAQIEFRKKALTSAKEEASVRARVLGSVERYREVEELLAIDGTWAPPKGFPREVTTAEHADQAASDMRQRWSLGLDPIPDLCALLEEHQIKVQVLDLPEDVSGLHAEVATGSKQSIRTVVVNAKQAGERQRFTLAHELGHLLLRVPEGKDGEKLCHRFASAFLMPSPTVVREIGPRRHALPVRELFRLKALFGVSAQAVAYRCRDLGVISEALFRSVFQTFGTKGWRKQEPNALPPEKPLRYERLVMRALAEDVIGEARAAELLGVSTWHLIEMLDSPPDDNDDGEPAGANRYPV